MLVAEDLLIMRYRVVEKIGHLLKKRRTFGKRTSNCLCKDLSFSNERDRIRIMVYGDSNSFRPGGGRRSWPGILQNKNRFHLKVINESCDGRTVGHDTRQYNGLADIRFRLDEYTSLDYIIIMLGTNDLKVEYGPPTPLEIIQDIGRLIGVVASYGGNIEPVLLTPPPMGMMTTGQLSGAHSRVRQLAAECRKLAYKRSIPLVDVYSILNLSDDFEKDMIHINATGRKKIANTVWSEILAQPTFQRQIGVENTV